jgi:hypothetical protein
MATSVPVPTNSRAAIQNQIVARHVTWTATLGVLMMRLVLFALFQAIIAGLYRYSGVSDPWKASIAWWPISGILTNIACLFALEALFRREGGHYWEVVKFERSSLRGDVLVFILISVLSLPLAYLPSILVATWLFGSQVQASSLSFLPLPLWAATFSLVLFPITIAITELPTYFGYVMPRLEALSGQRWIGVLLPSLFLAAQHCALPLIFNGRFILYRFAMFLPFALLMGITLRWRPRLLPYLMSSQAFLDLLTIWFVFSISIN